MELPDGGGTVDGLMVWWIEKFLRKAGSSTGESSIRKHIVGSALGRLRLTDITPGKVDLFLTEKEDGLSARSVNHLRGYMSRAFTMARRMERFPRAGLVRSGSGSCRCRRRYDETWLRHQRFNGSGPSENHESTGLKRMKERT